MTGGDLERSQVEEEGLVGSRDDESLPAQEDDSLVENDTLGEVPELTQDQVQPHQPMLKTVPHHECTLKAGQRFTLGNEVFHVYDRRKRGRFYIKFLGIME